jgi:acyl-CoA synthetase (AMP-forming)/AMP-acid ligase II
VPRRADVDPDPDPDSPLSITPPDAMAPTTLANAFSPSSPSTAVIVPGAPALEVSYQKLTADVKAFQAQLAKVGVSAQSAVSIALPNTYEFIVAFIAASWQRAIAAPLNPAYKQSEFEFYIDDLSSAIALVPKGAFAQDAAAVRAARKYNAAIAECYYNGKEVVLNVKEAGKLAGKSSPLLSAEPDDVALVLHTSGTTGRPKAVPLTHRNLLRTMHNIQGTYNLTHEDRTMLVMPLFHVHGLLAGFLAPLASGGSVVVPPKFSASDFWRDFATHKANWYTAVLSIRSCSRALFQARYLQSASSDRARLLFRPRHSTKLRRPSRLPCWRRMQ